MDDVILLYKSGLSIPDIFKKTGIPLSTIRFRLFNAGALRSRHDGLKIAAKAGKFSKTKGVSRPPFSDEWKKNISKGKILSADKNAKGSRITTTGHVEFTRGEHKGRFEHVVIMEREIGRRINRGECVHHINEIRTDNRIENLKLMTLSEHSSHHATENVANRNRDNKGRFL